MKQQSLKIKLNHLKKNILKLGKVMVAFSGGVDSSFLLLICSQVVKKNVWAVTIDSSFISQSEVKAARAFAKKYSIKHTVIKIDILSDKIITANPRKRCYFCKKKIMTELLDLARKKGYNHVLDGSQLSDFKVYRPGKIALKELGIISPLAQAKINKSDVRALAQKLKLKIWDNPSEACLATRFPYGTNLTRSKLTKVAYAEKILKNFGFKQLRIRVHGDIARIEVSKNKIVKLIKLLDNKSVKALNSIGYRYICVDLEGYRSGSMDNIK
ncbi:MAG: ATP-dependent sacrificial sulfur transferase LarE [Candidatus Omnitrophota bacterium]